MKYLGLALKWVGIILRVIPHLEKIYPQIVATIEVIKEEANNGEANGEIKKNKVTSRLITKLPSVSTRAIRDGIDSTVSVLKALSGGK